MNGTGTMNSTGTGSMNSMSTGSTTPSTTSTDMSSTTQPTGSSSDSSSTMGTTGNTTNGTYNNSTSVTPSGTNNYNTTTGANGATTTTPSTTGNYNSAGTTSTNTTYSTATTTTTSPRMTKDYKNFTYAIYAGLNTTRFKGESFDANGAASGLTGRLGYQLGFFVRGGGRLYGQIGAEYFASSSNYFTTSPGSGTTTATSIKDRIDIKYIQVPVYIGYKLTQSDRGLSAVRVQVGLEYANQIGSTANQFGNLNNFQLKSGTFNGLGQIGFDAGPVFLDLTYHHGFSNAIEQNTGFAGSQRRILSASLGFKF
ncbi:PorT family protein [Fibrella sp. HMF5335]|uniref:PorT family protein n=2 Tax=Fibrella rubiginis TaxID=2817060 RepID=A0A939K6R5_9BACT|nr:PorT family protein [Fibrella rubiginis]